MQTSSKNIKRSARPTPPGPRVLAPATKALAAALTVAVLAGLGRLLAVVWLSARSSVSAPGPAAAEEMLTLCAASLAVAVVAWMVLGMSLEVLARTPGRTGHLATRCSEQVTPALARRAVAVVLGVGVGVAAGPSQAVAGSRAVAAASEHRASPAGPANPGFVPTDAVRDAQDPGFPALQRRSSADAVPEPAVSPGFTPAAPTVRPQADPGLIGARPVASDEPEVVVHRGDSLWSIAARHLGPGASDAEIAHAWPLWFELNGERIGADPDLLLPGQVLRVPDVRSVTG